MCNHEQAISKIHGVNVMKRLRVRADHMRSSRHLAAAALSHWTTATRRRNRYIERRLRPLPDGAHLQTLTRRILEWTTVHIFPSLVSGIKAFP